MKRFLALAILVACAPGPDSPGDAAPRDGATTVPATDTGGADLCAAPGAICTVAGTGTAGFGADGSEALAAWLYDPLDVAFDAAGAPLIVDWNNHRILRLDDGHLATVVGERGWPGDGPEGPASAADVNHPTGVYVDGDTLWIAGFHSARLYRVDAAGELSYGAGTGLRGYAGDGGPATAAAINQPASIVDDGEGNLVFADQGNQLVRRIDPAGTVSTFAGTLGDAGCSGDGGPASEAAFGSTSEGYLAPTNRLLRVDRTLYVVDAHHDRIRAIDLDSGLIRTAFGADGCGAPPDVVVDLREPMDLAVGPDGALYLADAGNNCVRRVRGGVVDTVAGVCAPTWGFSGDGGPATEALLWTPDGIEVSPTGDLWIADTYNQRVRVVHGPL